MITKRQESDEYGTHTSYTGLSTDTKPGAGNGDVFLEMDTGDVYAYDEEGLTWRKL